MSTILDALYEKWANDWLPRIFNEVAMLHHHRVIWRGTTEMIVRHPESNTGFFLEALTKMYVDSQAMGVRRQAEIHGDDVISLGRLLTQVRDHPAAVDRDRYLSHWDTDEQRDPVSAQLMRRLAHDQFDELAGRDHPAVSRKFVETDLDQLNTVAGQIADYATRVVAHLDRRDLQSVPNFAELDAALDLLGEIVRRYYLLVRADGLVAVAPVIQGDWMRPFRAPLA